MLLASYKYHHTFRAAASVFIPLLALHMSNRKGKNVVFPISSSEEEEEEENDDDDDVEEEEEEEEEDDDDDDDDSDDDYDGESEHDTISISSSEDGIELSEEGEADRESMDEDSEAAPTDEANCNIVIKLLQGGHDLHVLRLEECKAYLRKHGLRLTGTKEICIERIQEHWRIKDGNGEKLYPRSSFTINCTGDVCQGDVVLFTQRIYKKFDIVTRGGKPIGKRTVAGRVVKESYGAAKQQHTFTVEILWSKGLKKLPPLFPLLIKGRNLYRLKTHRQRWKDEAARLRVLAEKHKRGAIARHIRETTKARSSNGGSKLQKESCKGEIPLKRPRNRGTVRSTKAQEWVFSHGRASSAGQVKTKGAAKTKDQSGSERKRESACTRTPKKRQKNNRPVITTRTQKPDISHVKAVDSSARHFVHANPQGNGFPMHHPIVGSHQNNYQAHIPYDYRVASPAYVASGGSYLCFEYERASTSIAGGMSRNKMAVPIPHHHAFHAGLDPRLSSCLLPQVPTGRQLNTVPPVLQKQIHKTGQLACSMSGCKDMGAKNCIGSFCWKCCRSTKRKCPRHKLP
eukprot:TRINITY_DN39314_c0_g2_i2.p1 TRINITY_DN39314_c0_g2~~TRINITY_DN39314_c0_g2_i2.p1  ORF type:complete len:571 (+),score=128.27 TRINITY_DN39314_c0_g2_i2:162-1874(+)